MTAPGSGQVGGSDAGSGAVEQAPAAVASAPAAAPDTSHGEQRSALLDDAAGGLTAEGDGAPDGDEAAQGGETGTTEQGGEEADKKEEEAGPYDEVIKMLSENPGPMTDFMISILKFMNKLRGIGNLFSMPGRYAASLEKSEEKFTKEEEDKLQSAEPLAKTVDGFEKPKIDPDASEESKLEIISKASTEYACGLLGIPRIDDAHALHSKLYHSPAYHYTNNLLELRGKTKMPARTVLVFKIKQDEVGAIGMGGALITAVATGNGHEFRYFDAEHGEERTIDLKKDEELIDYQSLQAVFIPKFGSDLEYFGEYPEELDASIDQTPLNNLEMVLAKIAAVSNRGAEAFRYLRLEDQVFPLIKQLGLAVAELQKGSLEVTSPPYDQRYVDAVNKQLAEVMYEAVKACDYIAPALEDNDSDDEEKKRVKASLRGQLGTAREVVDQMIKQYRIYNYLKNIERRESDKIFEEAKKAFEKIINPAEESDLDGDEVKVLIERAVRYFEFLKMRYDNYAGLLQKRVEELGEEEANKTEKDQILALIQAMPENTQYSDGKIAELKAILARYKEFLEAHIQELEGKLGTLIGPEKSAAEERIKSLKQLLQKF